MSRKIKAQQSQQGNTLIIVLVLIILVLVGVVIYFLTQSSKQQQTTTQPTQQQTGETTQPTETEGEPLPEKDAVATKDLTIVGRYPGSVRVGYSNDEQMERTAVDYVTKADKDEVKTYYISTLEEKGWEIETSEEDEIRFVKGEATLFLNFYYDEADKILKYYFEYYPTSNY